MKTLLTIMALCVVLAAACSTPSAPEYDPRPAYDSDLNRGWDQFEAGNYGLAAIEFRSALDQDSKRQWPDAYIGLAWSLAMQDSVDRAISHFVTALGKGPSSADDSADVYAGLGLSYREVSPPNFTQVRGNVQHALALDANYVFQYRSSINSDDLNAVLAEAFYNLGLTDSAAVIADPGATLDPDSATYLTDLLAKINVLLLLSMEGGL
jgi:tetratricopeptide (TPR) repeat protein